MKWLLCVLIILHATMIPGVAGGSSTLEVSASLDIPLSWDRNLFRPGAGFGVTKPLWSNAGEWFQGGIAYRYRFAPMEHEGAERFGSLSILGVASNAVVGGMIGETISLKVAIETGYFLVLDNGQGSSYARNVSLGGSLEIGHIFAERVRIKLLAGYTAYRSLYQILSIGFGLEFLN